MRALITCEIVHIRGCALQYWGITLKRANQRARNWTVIVKKVFSNQGGEKDCKHGRYQMILQSL